MALIRDWWLRHSPIEAVCLDMASVVQRLDVFWGEDAHAASAPSSPGHGTGAVQQIDDVALQKVEVRGLGRGVVTERVSQAAFLHQDG